MARGGCVELHLATATDEDRSVGESLGEEGGHVGREGKLLEVNTEIGRRRLPRRQRQESAAEWP